MTNKALERLNQIEAAPSAVTNLEEDNTSMALERLNKLPGGAEDNFGNRMPKTADGLSPDSAVNESKLSTYDRLALSFSGDDKTVAIETLKKNFADVKVNAKGEIVTLDPDTKKWYKADADLTGLEMTRGMIGTALMAHKLTRPLAKAFLSDEDNKRFQKEFIGDVADIGKQALLIGAGTAAAPASLTGLGVTGLAKAALNVGLVGGGTEAISTVMGRVMGTYEATLEDNLKDVAYEALTQAAGVPVAAGAAIAGKEFGKRVLMPMAHNFSKLHRGTQDAMRSMFVMMGNTTEEIADVVLDDPKRAMRVAKVMDNTSRATKNMEEFLGTIKTDNLNIAEKTGKAIPKLISKAWENGKKSILKNIPDTFVANVDDSLDEITTQAIKDGFVKLSSFDSKGNVLKTLSPKEAMQIVDNPKLLKLVKPEFSDFDEWITLRKAGQIDDSELGGLAFKETFDELQKIHKALFNQKGIPRKSGKAGAEQLMTFYKNINDGFGEIFQKLNNPNIDTVGANFLKPRIQGYKDTIRTSVNNQFDLVNQGRAWSDLNNMWSKAQDDVPGVLQLANNPKTTSKQWETFSKELASGSHKNIATNRELANLRTFFDRYSPEGKKLISDSIDRIQVNEAAAAFHPWAPKSMLVKLGLGGIGGVAATAGVTEQNPLLAAAGVGALALSSPRLQFQALRLASKSRAFDGKIIQGMASLMESEESRRILGRNMAEALKASKAEMVTKNLKPQTVFSDKLIETVVNSSIQGFQAQKLLQQKVEEFIQQPGGQGGQ